MIDIKYMSYIKQMIGIKYLYKIDIEIDNKIFPLYYPGHYLLSQFFMRNTQF